jgi:hypothetical protein
MLAEIARRTERKDFVAGNVTVRLVQEVNVKSTSPSRGGAYRVRLAPPHFPQGTAGSILIPVSPVAF